VFCSLGRVFEPGRTTLHPKAATLNGASANKMKNFQIFASLLFLLSSSTSPVIQIT
jgi:hypothetical protein